MSGISNYTLNQKISNLQAQIQSLPTPTLDAVLTAGNAAGGLSITGLNDVALTTINGSAYPPAVGSDNLTDVLTAGDDAGGLNITNLNDVALTTINGTAYPPVVADNTLTEVLTAGNAAGGLSITGLNDVALTTINGTAYPPPAPTSYNPILQSSGGSNLNSGNYNVRVGYYIQLGKIVWFEVRIQISGKGGLGSAGEDIRITLPITASSLTNLTQSLNVGNIVQTNTNIVSAFANIPSGGQGYVVFPIKETAGTTTANLEVGDISSTFQIRFGGFYFTD